MASSSPQLEPLEPSEYPKHHQFLCFVMSDDPPDFVHTVANEVAHLKPQTIDQVLFEILSLLSAHATGRNGAQSDLEDDDEEMVDEGHFDDDYGLNISVSQSSYEISCLQR